MLRLIIILFSVSIDHGSCTPTRMILDGNTKDLPTPGLTSWDLWDTDGGLFSPRIYQFDMYRPASDHLRDFGKNREEKFLMEYKNPSTFSHILETKCENFEDVKKRNIPMSSGLGIPVRCRRTIREWRVQKPLYIEEPGWIPVEVKGEIDDEPPFEGEDPFILARGKRSIKNNQKVDSGLMTKSNITRSKREASQSGIPKRNGDSDDSMKNFYRVFGEYLEGRSGYLQPRDKHSDIMDILSEPFIISRGKKTSKNHSGDNSGINSLNLDEKYRIMRDRRGEIMEQLLNEQDPFYIARGRRSSKDLSSLVHE